TGIEKRPVFSGASFRLSLSADVYFKAASDIACVHAPSGAAEITGSEPPDSNVINDQRST
ncbi:MAG: hypothetical protein QNL02_15335, partial [Paracoccaceae bacterium]